MTEGSGYKEYVAGLLAGVSIVIVGHPFDTVKVKLQKHNTEGNGMKYKSSLHCTTRILQTEGGGLNSEKPQPQAIVTSAAFAGAIISFILCPSELIKCRIQVQGTVSSLSSIRYSGPIDCALKTIQTEKSYRNVSRRRNYLVERSYRKCTLL